MNSQQSSHPKSGDMLEFESREGFSSGIRKGLILWKFEDISLPKSREDFILNSMKIFGKSRVSFIQNLKRIPSNICSRITAYSAETLFIINVTWVLFQGLEIFCFQRWSRIKNPLHISTIQCKTQPVICQLDLKMNVNPTARRVALEL